MTAETRTKAPGVAIFLFDPGWYTLDGYDDQRRTMDQFFSLSPQWRIVVCNQCQHAVWPSDVAGHLKGVRHRLRAKEAAKIKLEVQAAPVIQDAAAFESIRYLDEPIPELTIMDSRT